MKRYIVLGVFFVAAIALFVYVLVFGSDLIMTDNWDFVANARDLEAGTLSFSDLYAQYSLHRVFFPKLYSAIGYLLLEYNNRIFLLVSLWSALLLGWVVYRRTLKKETLGYGKPAAWVLVVPWLVMNIVQVQNLLWCVTYPFAVLFATLAFLFLEKLATWSEARCSARFWGYLLMASLASIMAAFSISNGLFVSLLGFGIIALVQPVHLRLRAAIIWSVVSVAIWIAFFSGYTIPKIENHASLGTLLHPKTVLDAVVFLMHYLGGMAQEYTVSFFIGLAALVHFFWAVWRIVKAGKQRENSFYLVLGTFLILSGLATFAGRGNLGDEFSLESRYAVNSALFLVINLALLDWEVRFYSLRWRRFSWLTGNRLTGLIAAGLLAVLFVASVRSLRYSNDLGRGFEGLVPAVLNYTRSSDDELRPVYHNPDVLRGHLTFLEGRGISVFSRKSAVGKLRDVAVYTLGDDLWLTKKGQPEKYFVSGWHDVEDNLTWMDGTNGVLQMDLSELPPQGKALRLRMDCYPRIVPGTVRRLALSVNGIQIAEHEFSLQRQTTWECTLPFSIATNRRLRFAWIDHGDLVHQKNGTDGRRLGFSLIRLRLTEDKQ